MANERIAEIAQGLGFESREVLRWAQDLGMEVTTASSSVTQDEASQLRRHVVSVMAATSMTCCRELVDVLRKVEARLPLEESPDSTSEEGFLALRASLGLRGSIDPVSPRLVEGMTAATASPVLPATARWCEGHLVDVTWIGKQGDGDFVVVASQRGQSAKGDLAERWQLKEFDPLAEVDRIEIKKGDQVVAVGGPIAPWQPQC